jgi:maltose alpha-D-glucosyltransferase/alpha-amylase
MRYEWDDHVVVAVHNFSPQPRSVSLHRSKTGNPALIDLLGTEDSHADDSGWQRIQLEAHGYRWYRAGGLDRNVARSDVTSSGSPRVRTAPSPRSGARTADGT